MNITFVTTCLPSLRKGSSVRIYNLIKEAVKSGNKVDVITLYDVDETPTDLIKDLGVNKYIKIARPYKSIFYHLFSAVFQRIPPYFRDYRSSELADVLKKYLSENKTDVIQIELLHTFDAIRDILPELKQSGVKIVLDEHNYEYKAFTESVSTFLSLKYLVGVYIAPKMYKIEKEAVKYCDHIFVCSEIDKTFIAKLTLESKITVLPNGVDCDAFQPSPLVSTHTIVFAGGVYYPPNSDALHYFFESIYPLVKKSIPDVSITLLGGKPNEWLEELSKSDNSILLPGLVPDVREYINKSRVCISPIRKGSGTSLKILEFMGSGKPIVTTSIGVRGISLREGDALIADTPEDFANAIIKLMKDDSLVQKTGKGARETAEKIYSWKIIGKVMSETLGGIL